MTNTTSNQFNQSAQGDFYLKTVNRLLSDLPKDSQITDLVLNPLIAAINLESKQAIYLMADIILKRNVAMSAEQKTHYLELALEVHKDAAYEAGLIYSGNSTLINLPNKNATKAAKCFYYAGLLKHPEAFLELLTAICNKRIEVDGKLFADICISLIAKVEDMNAALVYAGLLCGYKPENYKNLMSLPLNTERGFYYLYYIIENGSIEEASRAQGILNLGLRENIFPEHLSQPYLEFCRNYDREQEQSLASRPR